MKKTQHKAEKMTIIMNSDNKVDKKLNVKRIDAEIIWEGKRKEKFVPEGTHYAPLIQFDGEDIFHDRIVWSSDIIVGRKPTIMENAK